jgi:hypothetical protein
MALAVTVNFTITDSKGKSAVTKVRVPTGFTLADYSQFAIAMGSLIAAVSDGVITDISVGIPLSLSGATIRAVANTTADIAKKALLSAVSAVAGLFTRFNIPTYDESHTVTGSDAIDTSDPDVSALIAVYEAGVGGLVPVDARNNDVADVQVAREVFRKFN